MPYKVFVSSTFEDLLNHRRAVDDALRTLGMSTLDVVETGTRLMDVVETSFKALRKADVFVGLYASRYGDILDGRNLSLTELVYEEACFLKLPRFIYVVDPRESWSIEFLHTDVRGAMMRMFWDQLRADLTIRYFTTPEDVAEKVTFDLARFKDASPLPPRRINLIPQS